MSNEIAEVLKLEIADQIITAAQTATKNMVFIIHHVCDEQLKKIAHKIQVDLGYNSLLYLEKDKVINWNYFHTAKTAVTVGLGFQPKSLTQIANAIRFGGVPGITGHQILILSAELFKGTNPSQTVDIRLERAIELNAIGGELLY